MSLSTPSIRRIRIFIVAMMVCALCIVEAAAHTDAGSHSDTDIQISKGQSVELDLRGICRTELSVCEKQTLTVRRQPTEGVIFTQKNSDIVRYQHAGTSTMDDSFVFVASAEGKSESILVSFEISAKTPTLSISSPQPGTPVKQGDIEIVFAVEGIGVDHVHLALVEGQHVSVPPDAGSYTFENVPPGSYKLTATLASSSHRDIADTEISMRIRVYD